MQLSLSLLPLPHSAKRTGEARTCCVLLLEEEAVSTPGRARARWGPGRIQAEEGAAVGLGQDDRWKDTGGGGMGQIQRRLVMGPYMVGDDVEGHGHRRVFRAGSEAEQAGEGQVTGGIALATV